jgi:hypothetical protein
MENGEWQGLGIGYLVKICRHVIPNHGAALTVNLFPFGKNLCYNNALKWPSSSIGRAVDS